MNDRMPAYEADFWLGYETAKGDLRKLLGKVPEEQMLGVVMSWLVEEIDGRN